MSFLSGRRNRCWFLKRSFVLGRCRGLGLFLRNHRRRWFRRSRGRLSCDVFSRSHFFRFCLWRCRCRLRGHFNSLLFFNRGRFRFHFAFLYQRLLGQSHFRRRGSPRPCRHSSAVNEVGVCGSAVGVHVDRAFEFSADHVPIVKCVNLAFGGVPRERAEAGCVVVLVPISVPGCSLTGSWSAIPNRGLAVFGLLIFALGKCHGCPDEPCAAEQD